MQQVRELDGERGAGEHVGQLFICCECEPGLGGEFHADYLHYQHEQFANGVLALQLLGLFDFAVDSPATWLLFFFLIPFLIVAKIAVSTTDTSSRG